MFTMHHGGTPISDLPPPQPASPGGMYRNEPTSLLSSPEPLNIPDSPPKLPRRPPKKGNKRETLSDIARRVPVEVIRPYFNYPLRRAAEALCISVTTLKRLCRRHGVKRWPHRQLSGLNRAVSHLEAKRLALKDGPNDPIIADQLRQLYCRRDVIIDLAFMTEEEAAAARENMHSVKPEYPESAQTSLGHGGVPGHMSSSGHSLSEGTVVHGGASMVPWWHRDSGAVAVASNSGSSSGSGGGGVGSASHFMGLGQSAHNGGLADHHRTAASGRLGDGRRGATGESFSQRIGGGGGHYGLAPSGNIASVCGGGGGGSGGVGVGVNDGGGSMPSYRGGPSVMARRFSSMAGGSSGMPPPVKMEHHPPQSPSVSSSFKLPSPGTLLAGIPSSSSSGSAGCQGGGRQAPPAVSAGGGTVGHNNARRRPMSPMTIGTPTRVGGGSAGGGSGVVKAPPPHFIPLPSHHPSDMVDNQIAELANLNDILFGPDQGGEMMMDQNGLTLMIPGGGSSGPVGSSAQQRVSGSASGGVGGEGGRLPSIAGLVAAGHLLNNGKQKQWRPCRDNGAAGGLVRGCTGEV